MFLPRFSVVFVVLSVSALGLSACTGSKPLQADWPESCRTENYGKERSEERSTEEQPDTQKPELIGGLESLYGDLSYPPKAREIGAEGTSWIQFVLSPEGEPTEVRVCQTAGNSILDREALEAVRQLEFRPGMRGGEPVEVRMTLPVNFSLNR